MILIVGSIVLLTRQFVHDAGQTDDHVPVHHEGGGSRHELGHHIDLGLQGSVVGEGIPVLGELGVLVLHLVVLVVLVVFLVVVVVVVGREGWKWGEKERSMLLTGLEIVHRLFTNVLTTLLFIVHFLND